VWLGGGASPPGCCTSVFNRYLSLPLSRGDVLLINDNIQKLWRLKNLLHSIAICMRLNAALNMPGGPEQ